MFVNVVLQRPLRQKKIKNWILTIHLQQCRARLQCENRRVRSMWGMIKHCPTVLKQLFKLEFYPMSIDSKVGVTGDQANCGCYALRPFVDVERRFLFPTSRFANRTDQEPTHLPARTTVMRYGISSASAAIIVADN